MLFILEPNCGVIIFLFFLYISFSRLGSFFIIDIFLSLILLFVFSFEEKDFSF